MANVGPSDRRFQRLWRLDHRKSPIAENPRKKISPITRNFLIIYKMKKIIGVIAIMLSVVLLLLYRQLTNGHGPARTIQQKVCIPAIMQENLILGNMLFQ